MLQVIEVPSISNDPFLDDLQQYLLEDTVKQSFATSRCADLSTHWKEDLSKSQKLVQSVTSRLPVDWDSARTKAFVQRVEDSLASAEALFPKVRRGAATHCSAYNILNFLFRGLSIISIAGSSYRHHFTSVQVADTSVMVLASHP